jgi:uncharacterized protein YjiS (DUF1127 family)
MDTRYFGGNLTALNEIQADRGRSSEPAAEDAYYRQNMSADGRVLSRRDEEFRLALASHVADYRKRRVLIAAKDGCDAHNSVQPTTTAKLRNLAAAGAARLVALWNAVKNRRSVARLPKWDDHMLSDIGLTRGDVRSALAAPFSEDPSDRLGALQGERRSAARATALERPVPVQFSDVTVPSAFAGMSGENGLPSAKSG